MTHQPILVYQVLVDLTLNVETSMEVHLVLAYLNLSEHLLTVDQSALQTQSVQPIKLVLDKNVKILVPTYVDKMHNVMLLAMFQIVFVYLASKVIHSVIVNLLNLML